MYRASKPLKYRLGLPFRSDAGNALIRNNCVDKALQTKYFNEIRYSFPINPNALLVERHKLTFGEYIYQYISTVGSVMPLILLMSAPCYLLYYNSLVVQDASSLTLTDMAKFVTGQAPKPCDNIIAIYYLKRTWNLNFLYKKIKSLNSSGNLLVTLVDCNSAQNLPVELEKTLLLDNISIHFYKFTASSADYAEIDSNLQTKEVIKQIKQFM